MIGKKKVLQRGYQPQGLINKMPSVINVIYNSFLLCSRVCLRFSRILSVLAKKCEPEDIQQQNVIRSTRYDMVGAVDEPYYAEQYWNIISPYLEYIPENALVYDLGCGQGRLTMLLSKRLNNANFLACDLSENAILKAREYASSNGLNNIDFKVEPISDFIFNAKQNSADLILLTEVTVFYPQWKKELEQMLLILKPGGIMVISLRSQYFNAMCLVRNRNWESIDTVIDKREGEIFGSSTVLTWQTSTEVKKILVDEYSLELLTMYGLGTCSGIPGDPHDSICKPSELSKQEQAKLMKIELGLGQSIPDSGRYILAVVRKPLT